MSDVQMTLQKGNATWSDSYISSQSFYVRSTLPNNSTSILHKTQSNKQQVDTWLIIEWGSGNKEIEYKLECQVIKYYYSCFQMFMSKHWKMQMQCKNRGSAMALADKNYTIYNKMKTATTEQKNMRFTLLGSRTRISTYGPVPRWRLASPHSLPS